MAKVIVSEEEQKAIRSLERLAKKWPSSLEIFSWSGSTLVVKLDEDEGRRVIIRDIPDIPSDGGDPGEEEFDQDGEVEYE